MTTKRRMSDIPKYKDQVIAFFKFTNFTDSLVDGNLYMSPLKRYIEMEKESGEKGVGDVLEAAQVFSNIEFRMYDQETEELVFTGTSGSMNLRMNGDENRPVYCLFTLHSENLSIVDEDEEYYTAVMNFSDEEIEKMISEFGEKVVLINANSFVERMQKTFNNNGYGYVISPVRYDDYSVNYTERIDSYQKNNNEIFFWKDNFFENQKEYRIVITNIETEEPITVNIGDLSDITTILNARELFSEKWLLHLKK